MGELPSEQDDDASDSPTWREGIYNRLAGGSVDRIAALSDGIFGVGMTLLLLDLHVPAREVIQNEANLRHALLVLCPKLVVYLMSFITLGIFWVAQQTQLNHLMRSDRRLTWRYMLFLFPVTIMPFSTELLAQFMAYRAALFVYWLNMALLGGMLFICWRRAERTGLISPDASEEFRAAMRRRIVSAQVLYGIAMATCVINTYVSIGLMVLLQLNYVIGPPVRWLSDI